MAKENEDFLQAEQSASDILTTLEQLKNEAVSYKHSVQELNIVREKLSGVINNMQVIAKDIFEVVKLLKSIGGPEILDRLEKNTEQSKALKTLTIITLVLSGLSIIGVAYLIIR